MATSTENPPCKQCGNELVDGAKYAISALGAQWHKDCFNCCGCQQRLFSFAKFFNRGGYPVCKICNDKENPECGACGRRIEGRYVTSQGKQWHNECFKCTGCEAQLEGTTGFFEDDGKLWHLECFAKAPAASTFLSPSQKKSVLAPKRFSMPPNATRAATTGAPPPKFCMNCGAQNPGSKFCGDCGNKID